ATKFSARTPGGLHGANATARGHGLAVVRCVGLRQRRPYRTARPRRLILTGRGLPCVSPWSHRLVLGPPVLENPRKGPPSGKLPSITEPPTGPPRVRTP